MRSAAPTRPTLAHVSRGRARGGEREILLATWRRFRVNHPRTALASMSRSASTCPATAPAAAVHDLLGAARRHSPRDDQARARRRRCTGRPGIELVGDNAKPGTLLDVSQPCGDVVLEDTDDPVVLVSAGIRITPVAAILEDLTPPARPHGATLPRRPLTTPTPSIRRCAGRCWRWAMRGRRTGTKSAPTTHPRCTGQVRADGPPARTSQRMVVFMCGPLPFMNAARKALLAKGVAPERDPLRGLRAGPVGAESGQRRRLTDDRAAQADSSGGDTPCASAPPACRRPLDFPAPVGVVSRWTWGPRARRWLQRCPAGGLLRSTWPGGATCGHV